MAWTINAVNVAEAWARAVAIMEDSLKYPQWTGSSQGRRVHALPGPVVTTQMRPYERVLLDPVRDANPLFHMFESLWMLAGRDDARWLDRFVSDYSARFAQENGIQHGAYGKRWRSHFERFGKSIDQLDTAVDLLRKNPLDRQVVLQMWDPLIDLGITGLLDRPCNTSIYLRADRGVLDLTVLCRSNDLAWGALGSNSVHFSMLQEYLAARIGLPIGHMIQFSNNFHIYEDALHLMNFDAALKNAHREYPGTRCLVDDPETFDHELHEFMSDPEGHYSYTNRFFEDTAYPMWMANVCRRRKLYTEAVQYASQIAAPDWRVAVTEWLERRAQRRAARAHRLSQEGV